MSPSTYPMNQFAPVALAGVQRPPAELVGYEDRPFEYLFNPPGGQLTANQFINPATVAIQTDADFYMASWYLSLFTGVFQVQLLDSTGYQLQSGMMNSGGLSQADNDPTVFSPAHPFPAGSKIQVVIQDLSGATNPLQIVFKGWKRFRMPMRVAA